MNDKPILDVVGLFVTLTALAATPEIADVVGPYMVILVAAVIGASFALARRTTSSRLLAVWFMARVAALAVLLTVGAASFVNAMRPELHVRGLLAPIALLVGFIGDDWPRLLAKVMKGVFAAVDFFRPTKGGNP